MDRDKPRLQQEAKACFAGEKQKTKKNKIFFTIVNMAHNLLRR